MKPFLLGEMMTYKNDLDRITTNVIIDDLSGCWNWIKSKHSGGYSHLRVNGKMVQGHRFSYSLFVGKIPKGSLIMHKCDNRLCVNPDHLTLGTTLDNMRDMVAKRRHGAHIGKCIHQKGADNKMSRPVIVDGTEYGGISEAARKIGISRGGFQRWLRTGRAVYAIAFTGCGKEPLSSLCPLTLLSLK